MAEQKEKIWAVVSENHGILTLTTGDGTVLPCVALRKVQAQKMYDIIIKDDFIQAGDTISLLEFSSPQSLESMHKPSDIIKSV